MPDPLNPTQGLDLGHVAEGVIEVDPMTGRMVVRSETPEGFTYLDVQEALTRYEGQEVRVVIVPFTTINRVAELVESGSVQPDQIPSAGNRSLRRGAP
jgi:hypothetical protein